MITDEVIHRYAVESNAIAGISVDTRSLSYTDHVKAARYVAEQSQPGKHGWHVEPTVVHELLLQGLDVRAGKYRSTGLTVSGSAKPDAAKVPILMNFWMRTYFRYWRVIVNYGNRYKDEWVCNRAWFLHDIFLCISPFQHGNGRVARLLLNGVLVGGNAGWHTVCSRDVEIYYSKVRDFRDHVYLPWRLDVT